MWLANPINPSKYKIVRRFDLIVAIAKVMRGCHFYYVSARTHALYGIAEQSTTVRVVPIPDYIEVNASFIFRIETMDKDVIAKYVDFVLLDDMQWALLPLIKSGEFEYYTPFFKPVSEYQLWTIIDIRNRQEVEFLDLYGVEGSKTTYLRDALQVVESFEATRGLSRPVATFTHMERSPIIKQVFSSRAAMGEKFLPLYFDNRSYGLYIYKNLFTFNKNDRLDITVYDRMDCYGVFEASFDVIHDKNPIKFVFDGDFGEITYGTFLRVK